MRKTHRSAGLDQLGPTYVLYSPPPGGSVVPGLWRPKGKRPVISRNKANENIRRRADASTRVRKVKVTLAKVSQGEDD